MGKQLVIFTSPVVKNEDLRTHLTPSEFGQHHPNNNHNRKGKLTPRIKQQGSRRVINLPFYDPETNYKELAQDLCYDAGDKYYGHIIN